MINIFIIGSKGIPAKYGGFETFVDNLTRRKKNSDIKYHVSCLSNESGEFIYNDARCFNVKTPKIGSAKAVLYDLLSLKECCRYIRENNLKNCIVYILASRIGPFLNYYSRQLHNMGAKLYLNPDGHEWKRSKWNRAIKYYWKYSERLMVKSSDLIICDSKGIEKYINEQYRSRKLNTTFIAYGADVSTSNLKDYSQDLIGWFNEHQVQKEQYYLIVGRFVPENNYELMISEYMKSSSKKDLVIIANIEKNDFYYQLLKKTNFSQDKRIKFVGTVYNEQLLKKIREIAYGYIHGHEVGGTNPSLLEALASTKINLLLDVDFNKEVGMDGAKYFSKEVGSLAHLINRVDSFSKEEINILQSKSMERIINHYSWDKIVNEYEQLFTK